MLILSTLPTNISLGLKSLPMKNTLAYHSTELVMTVKNCSGCHCRPAYTVCLASKYKIRVEESAREKHSSLPWYGISYDHKKV
jgi:hypothetical protein